MIIINSAGEGGSCSEQLSNGDSHFLFHDIGHSSGEIVFPHLSKSPVSGISQNCKLKIKLLFVQFYCFGFWKCTFFNFKGLFSW